MIRISDTWVGRALAPALVLAAGIVGALYFANAAGDAQARKLAQRTPARLTQRYPRIVDAGMGRLGFAWPHELGATTLQKAGVWIWDHRARAGRWAVATDTVYRDGVVVFSVERPPEQFPPGARFSFRLWIRFEEDGRTRSHLSEDWLRWCVP